MIRGDPRLGSTKAGLILGRIVIDSPQSLSLWPVRKTPHPGASIEGIEEQIRVLHGRPVLIDADLAALCGVSLPQLREALGRHEPLAGEMCFEPEQEDLLAAGQAGSTRRGSRYAFTEHGAFLAVIVLNLPEAIAMSVRVVRAFVRHRERRARADGWARRLGPHAGIKVSTLLPRREN